MTEDAGCDVAPQKWGHDSTEALVERVRRGIISTWTSDEDTNKAGFREALAALTELAERLKAAEIDRAAYMNAKVDAEERAEAAERELTFSRKATRNCRKAHLAAEAQRDEALAAAKQVPQLVEALERIARKELVPHWTSFQQLESCREVAHAALAKVRR